MGVIDVLFARQCLVRAYPSLLSPPTLAMQHGGHTGPPGGRWPAYKPPKSGPGLNCAAAGAALAMHCSECATDAACVENRTVASVTTNRKKQCDASDLGEMVDIDKSTWGPRVNLSQVTKLWLEANPSVPLWETVLPELRPCETTHEEHATFVVDGYPTCECYEQHTGCAAAMEDAMVAMHEHPGGCGSALPPRRAWNSSALPPPRGPSSSALPLPWRMTRGFQARTCSGLRMGCLMSARRPSAL
jgi:hypothetical protein